MKKQLVLLTLLLASVAGFAQQDAQFSQWMFNKMDLNPAFTGTDRSICGTAIYRNQWVGFAGAPTTVMASVGGYFPIVHGGLGLTVFNDKLGFSNTFIAQASYSYHLSLQGGASTLGIGVDAGLFQQSVNGTWNSTDPSQLDPSIPASGTKVTTYDLGLGLYYTTGTGMFFGLSSTHLPENTINSSNIQTNYNNTTQNSKLSYELARHYYFMAGIPFTLSATYKLVPSILAKSDGASTTFDIDARMVWQNKVWFGLGYRLSDAVIAMVGMQWGTALIGYSYDFTTSNIRNYSSGSHEIVLRYCMKPYKEPAPTEWSNPRYFY